MLTIRDQQLEAFRHAFVEKFVDELEAHLQRVWPAECQARGSAGNRRFIHNAMEDAQRYGLCAKRDVARFVDLVHLIGPEFARDPEWCWAARMLSEGGGDPATRLDQVYARLEDALREKQR